MNNAWCERKKTQRRIERNLFVSVLFISFSVRSLVHCRFPSDTTNTCCSPSTPNCDTQIPCVDQWIAPTRPRAWTSNCWRISAFFCHRHPHQLRIMRQTCSHLLNFRNANNDFDDDNLRLFAPVKALPVVTLMCKNMKLFANKMNTIHGVNGKIKIKINWINSGGRWRGDWCVCLRWFLLWSSIFSLSLCSSRICISFFRWFARGYYFNR